MSSRCERDSPKASFPLPLKNFSSNYYSNSDLIMLAGPSFYLTAIVNRFLGVTQHFHKRKLIEYNCYPPIDHVNIQENGMGCERSARVYEVSFNPYA